MITGEDWNKIMHDLSIEDPYCVFCNFFFFLSSLLFSLFNISSKIAENVFDGDCGSPSWSFFLFITFYILVTFIVLNIFVAIILDRFSFWYEKDETTNRLTLTRDDLRG